MKTISGLVSLFSRGFIIAIFCSCSTNESYVGAYQAKNDNVGSYTSDIERSFRSYEGPARNPVIVIHGFLGSKLKNSDNDNNVWGLFTGSDVFDGYTDEYLRDLSYPMAYGRELKDIKDYVVPYEFMSDAEIRIVGITIDQSAYREMLDVLISMGFVTENMLVQEKKKLPSLFTFYYDWRRTNVENVRQLHEFIFKKRAFLQKRYEEEYGIKDFDVQFNIIAHSMGGMITRYYLMYGNKPLASEPVPSWEGCKYVERVIIVGTPNLGFLNTCFELTEGLQVAPGMPIIPPAIIGTWASIYQMIPFACTNSVVYSDDPSGKSVNLYDPEAWKNLKWGLADPAQDQYLQVLLPDVKTPEARRKIALDHLEKCLKEAENFAKALQIESEMPGKTALFLFLGDSVNTRKKASVDRLTGKLETIVYDGGDGIALSTSARMDTVQPEYWKPFVSSCVRWHTVVHLNADHMGITDSHGFEDNVPYYLMITPVKGDIERIRYLKKILGNSQKYMKNFQTFNKEQVLSHTSQ
ncbi:MAG TPA: hypothetical protein DD381_00020 [Lentisphaeria bacterium]|nr:MAG: hypothetical protein A2X47_12830 [Lentisphaerae bacterium GWF2_38_69]HBM14728.1 hypothetical protein [Lentisphaeria bacterium]